MTPTRSPVASRLRAAREELRTAGPPPGRDWCRAWTDEVDAALVELHAPVAALGRSTVAAVGGYGRRELCPWSDVDLLVLHDGVGDDDLAKIVRAVVYPLWDAGLQVGYAVRGRRDAVAAADDVDSATAALDARRVVGDPSLVSDVRQGVLQRLRRRRSGFLEGLTAADVDRRARSGDAAEVLEPDLKNGAGGLRDVQSLRWAAAALVGATGLDPLVSARYLGAPDRSRLARSYDRLLAIRVALHLERDRADDTLHLECQQPVARRLGYVDGGDERDTAAHRLLRDLFLDARTVDHVHRRAWSLVSADAVRGRRFRRPAEEEVDGFDLVDGVVRLRDEPRLDDASLPARLGAVLARHGAVLDRTTAAALRHAVDANEGRPLPWAPRDRDRFLAMLWRGDPALGALAELDDVGLLTAAIPEWEPLRGRAQRNPYHRYSLDRHAWHAAAALGELVRHESWAADLLGQVDDRTGLMLGVLLHDVGKAHGEPHSETGIPVARAVARRLGAGPDSVDLVGRLVELHLLLPDVATRRDLADPTTIREVAALVGDRGTLACLHLLAAADGVATGASAWTSWKASLVSTLSAKVTAVFDDEDPIASEATVREAQRLAPRLGVDPDVVRDHLAQLPARYPAAVPPRAIVRHAGVAAAPLTPAEVRTRVTPGSRVPEGDRAVDELDVVALDSPGLFAKVAGVLALHGGSVLEANAFTRDDGVAVDMFVVQRPTDATGSWWAAVEGDIDEAVAGRLAVRARVARKAATARRRPGPAVPTTVGCQPDPSGSATLVEVRTADRLGVLYRIASALAELELDVVLARISTVGHEVVDVFFVRDAGGNPLDDDHVAELVLAVESALEG